jgi:hypothetical protein
MIKDVHIKPLSKLTLQYPPVNHFNMKISIEILEFPANPVLIEPAAWGNRVKKNCCRIKTIWFLPDHFSITNPFIQSASPYHESQYRYPGKECRIHRRLCVAKTGVLKYA